MKILLADDHSLFRAGIRHLLLQLALPGETLEIEEAGDHASVIECLEAHGNVSLVLLDLGMPGNQGLTALEALTHRYPALPIVVLSASEDRTEIQRSLDIGALGFVPKAATPAVMLSALRLVLAGGIYVPPELTQGGVDSTLRVQPSALTPRQSAVLALVTQGKSNKVIASKLGVTEATVKAHVTAVLKSLGVRNRTQAAVAGRTAPS